MCKVGNVEYRTKSKKREKAQSASDIRKNTETASRVYEGIPGTLQMNKKDFRVLGAIENATDEEEKRSKVVIGEDRILIQDGKELARVAGDIATEVTFTDAGVNTIMNPDIRAIAKAHGNTLTSYQMLRYLINEKSKEMAGKQEAVSRNPLLSPKERREKWEEHVNGYGQLVELCTWMENIGEYYIPSQVYNRHYFLFLTERHKELGGGVTMESCAGKGKLFRVVFSIRADDKNIESETSRKDVSTIEEGYYTAHDPVIRFDVTRIQYHFDRVKKMVNTYGIKRAEYKADLDVLQRNLDYHWKGATKDEKQIKLLKEIDQYFKEHAKILY